MGKASRKAARRQGAVRQKPSNRAADRPGAPSENPDVVSPAQAAATARRDVEQRMVRLRVDDDDWFRFRAIALASGAPVGELLGRLVRKYIADPTLGV